MRAAVYYLFSFAVMAAYGGRVCSFVESLTLLQWSTILLVSLGAAFAARAVLVARFVRSAPPLAQARRQFVLELILFAAVGAAVTIFDRLAYGFVLGSGLKMILGCLTLGFFGALDLALQRERIVLRDVLRAGSRLPGARAGGSLTRKFARVAFLITLLVTGVLLLVVAKNVQRIAAAGTPAEVAAARGAVLLEVSFVMLVLTGLVVNLIRSYSRNLKLFFDRETDVLDRVARDELDGYVPVTSRDEFGLIADRTNTMIDGLRERRRIKNVFGKVVSPEIARRLLAQDEGEVRLGGSRRNLVILFTDVRGFTALTEKLDPETLVQILNRHFSRMVEIIRREGGLVDKFIGDGILAVFGLDDPTGASERAVSAARAMQAAAEDPLRIGIGIHRGDVIAGNIGSPERLEFTFIGDAVNVASRLEGLTKTLGAPILVSASIRADLQDGASALPWSPFGSQTLKGRNEPVEVFGLGAPPPSGL